MERNETIHGFVLREKRDLPEIGATLYRMEFEKNGADLVWLDRPDDNKTFAITFKTIPQDDTGVFHILEHSVLNGSEKYPVKEPFVELLKSSLQTFLNAFTFWDKTMYPVCSRNDQDFLNLIDVYLDAVFHPLSLHNPHAFLQEGWHYELDSTDSPLRVNGVVYNEMKGAYADPDSTLGYEMNRALFPDTCYGFESGGHPDSIPTLTYQNYLDSHSRFYHPSNARIFLDGQIDLDAVLGHLEQVLGDYESVALTPVIPLQKAVHPAPVVAEYEIDDGDSEENKVIFAKAWVIGTFADREKRLAMSVITALLTGSNEAPLKKALLDRGLCEDMDLSLQDELQQPYLALTVRNTSQEKIAEILSVVDQVLQEQVTNGLDRKRLGAVLNNVEFSLREKDYGTMPKGLVYAITAQQSWLYEGDPVDGLCYDAVCKNLRDYLDTDWYEQLIRSAILENDHSAQVVLLPSKTLASRRAAKEATRLAEIKATWDEKTCQQVMADFAKLRERQNTPDTPEQLACLPALSLADIPKTMAEDAPANQTEINGVTVLWEPLETNGIDYLTLYFSLSDIPQEQLREISFFTRLIGNLNTRNYSALELRSELEGHMGSFSVSPSVFAIPGQTDTCSVYLAVRVAALESERDEVSRLILEILTTSTFSDLKLISQILRQQRIGIEQQISMSGHTVAARRVASSFTAQGAVNEALEGIEYLRWLQHQDDTFDQTGADLAQRFADLFGRLFTGNRLTINLTGKIDQSWLANLISALPESTVGEQVSYEKRPVSREGLQIPAEISFAVRAGNLNAVDGNYSGAARVAAQFLTYDYLWNAVRVKGGAYGTGLSVTLDGNTRFYSYRDPDAQKSLDTFNGAGEALRALADSKDSVEKYVISSIGDLQPVMTPRLRGTRAAADYFIGRSHADRQQIYTQVLNTTSEDLRLFADQLDRVCAASGVCVVGGKAALEACQSELDSIETIQ